MKKSELKAKQLVDKFIDLNGHIKGQCKNLLNTLFISQAKQCASICADQLIDVLPSVHQELEDDEIEEFGGEVNCGDTYYEFWEDVKQEIQKI